ncbi:epoxide hydrolase [Dyadobacter sp. CY107]|uniref:epoxide hydrolase family protein n=1 Tax=Dyadobacter fanqingshengii TaxID=2906443 RepID=UPI001F44732E|nr:epoxide hydrolase family protein [Dyadobacter fanqingshengii]MCF2505277.1 epoxide hydrolase [Dyadobacter fanqingshengii]
MKTSIIPFKIQVPQEVLTDLQTRLKMTRWAPDQNNEDQFYGLSTAFLKEYADHWLQNYDWREQEEKLNSFNQYKIDIEGQPIHFIYEKGKGPNPVPIILSHGWPWTYWHWSKLIGPLTDPVKYGGKAEQSFDVIIPSLPGFGFSTPVEDPEINFWKIADLWHKLMKDVLGYEKYAAAGSDYGMLVTAQLGHKYADELIGIHLGHEMPLQIFQSERPWDLTEGNLVPADLPEEQRNEFLNFQKTFASHVAVHMLDSQTLTHGLNDSPVGMLAWILQRWKKWSDKHTNFEDSYTKDDLITFAMIYWINQAIGTSMRVYANAARYPWKPSHSRTPAVEAAAGFSLLVGEVYPPFATIDNRVNMLTDGPLASQFNIVYAKAFQKGGHFGPWENPAAFIEGIRDTFDPLK